MIDLYNDLGVGYKPTSEIQKNLMDLYLKIYYPKIKSDDFKYIISYLNNEPKVESSKINNTFDSLMNDLVMETEIMYSVEEIKKINNYKKIFGQNYITQTAIHVNLRLPENTKLDLYRIFNEFIPDGRYPFIQYHTPDGQFIFKFKESEINEYLKIKDNSEMLSKWFENAPYGLSFKIRVKVRETSMDKFMSITIHENGRIEYKTRWKEDDNATIEDVRKTYSYVNDLIKNINNVHSQLKLNVPNESEYKYAFINTILKYELPDKFTINHNDLSEFSRYFYPYVALVIEPRKRQAKIQKGDTKSKFGTYLRYKRVSKYDNQSKIEQRVMYFMRNYEYNIPMLINEISKQFNITDERAAEEIEKVKNKYKNIKKSRKILKKWRTFQNINHPELELTYKGNKEKIIK